MKTEHFIFLVICALLFWGFIRAGQSKNVKILNYGNLEETTDFLQKLTQQDICRLVKGDWIEQKCELRSICYRWDKIKDKLGYHKGYSLTEGCN